MVLRMSNYEDGFNGIDFKELSKTLAKNYINGGNKLILDKVFSIGGRKPIETVLKCLDETEAALYKYIVDNPSCRFITNYVFSENQKVIAVGLLKSSAPIIRVVSKSPEYNYGIILGYFVLNEGNDDLPVISSREEPKRSSKVGCVYEDYFTRLTDEQVWEELAKINYVHKHMAPVTYKHDGRIISNFYLKGTSGSDDEEINIHEFLEELMGRTAENWFHTDREFIFCLIIMGKSGAQTRYEEFNNTNLSIASLHEHLVAKYRAFSKDYANYNVSEILELAEKLKKVREQRLQDKFVYRLINGITLNKQEVVSHKLILQEQVLPNCLITFFSKYGIRVRCLRELSKACDELYRKYQYATSNELYPTVVEELLGKIVESARDELDSDIAMTRGIRDISGFVSRHVAGDYQSIINYKPLDYFCYVNVSKEVESRIETNSLLKIVNAIAARMRFNSWHYVPGNFDKKLAGIRDYYIPPVLSDIANNSDLHHSGHVHARVKHSIRSPESISIQGHVYKAFVDLRLMRMSGEPYSESDLRLANYYTAMIKVAYQSIVDHVVQKGGNVQLRFATKDWYKQVYNIKPQFDLNIEEIAV